MGYIHQQCEGSHLSQTTTNQQISFSHRGQTRPINHTTPLSVNAAIFYLTHDKVHPIEL